MDSTTIPRGIHRDPSSAATPPRPVPTRNGTHSALANEIGLRAAERIDELALIGYPALDPATRAVYATAIRMAAEKVLDA